MSRRAKTRILARIAGCTSLFVATMAAPGAQDARVAEVAAKMTGTWTLNRELSPNLDNPGRRGGGAMFRAQPAIALQRGGRGGGAGSGRAAAEAGSPLTDEEVAAQAALSILRQIPLQLTILATATEFALEDPRGKWAFKIDDKTTPMEVPGGRIRVKTKWERLAVKQEFSSSQRKLVKTWSIDANDRLVLAERVESLSFNPTESKAVFDRLQ